MLKLGELCRLKEKDMKERSTEETDTNHLEYEEHPDDAKADQRALDKRARPYQTELQDCYHKGRWVSEGLKAQNRCTLK